jgi:hypothetical protein
MILGDIIDNQLAVLRDEFLHPSAFVPTSMIHPKVNHHSIESIENISEQGQESIGISFFLLQHAMSASDRVNPTENIEAFMMLTFGQHKGLGTLFSPDPPQLRMQTKPCLIREKKNHFPFASSYLQEFFLPSCETPQPLALWLERNGKLVAAMKTPAAESTAGLAALLIVPHGLSQDILPQQFHPSGFASGQILWGLSLRLSLNPSEFVGQGGRDDQAASSPLTPKALAHLLCESISPHSSGLNQTAWQFVMISTLAKVEAWRQYVVQSTPLVFSLPSPKGFHVLLICWLLLMLSWYSSLKEFSNLLRKELYMKTNYMSIYL